MLTVVFRVKSLAARAVLLALLIECDERRDRRGADAAHL